jgi:hypothetical membrane protein
MFVVSVLIQESLRDGYDPLRHPVSSLALGQNGWIQSATFIVAGVLTCIFASVLPAGLRGGRGRRWGPVLVVGWGVGLIGAGLFTADPVSGYPAGTPDLLPRYGSTAAAAHDTTSLIAFLALAAAYVVFGRRFAEQGRRGRVVYTAGTAVIFVGALGVSSLGFAQNSTVVGVAGLFQRIMIIVGWAWLTLLVHDQRLAAGAAPGGIRVAEPADPAR